MNLEIVIMSGASQEEKDKYHVISFICQFFLKNVQMSLVTKQKESHRCRKQTHL